MPPLRLNVLQWGPSEAPPLVLLHGLYGNAREWLPIASALCSEFHIIAPDLRNHGASPHASRHDAPSMAADVLHTLNSLIHTPCAVIGHSMGGQVAQHLAIVAPQRVCCLVLLDSPMLGVPISPQLADAHCHWQLALEQTQARQGVDREAMRALLRPSMPEHVASLLLTNYVRREGEWAWRLGLEGIHHYVSGMRSGAPESSPISQPLLLVRAAGSEYTTGVTPSHLQRFAPRATVLELPGDDHYPHHAHRERVLGAVREFLGQHFLERLAD